LAKIGLQARLKVCGFVTAWPKSKNPVSDGSHFSAETIVLDFTLILVLPGAFGLGAAHAFEADHLTAVSAFVAQRPAPRVAFWFGIKWAVGHGLSLLLLGSLLYGFKLTLSSSLADSLEHLVGVALLVLGIWTLFQLRPGALKHTHDHHHAPRESVTISNAPSDIHTHADGTTHSHAHHRGALWMGVLHGVAGTAAFVGESLVAVSQTYFLVVAYTLAFSVGVLLAMSAYAAALGSALTWSERRFTFAAKGVHFLAGVWACGIGFYWIVK
jgi:ABC-type nickel/cobalt efflux system permease component RcnA